MMKALVFISAVLVFTYPACKGLECYNCWTSTDSRYGADESQLQRCNEQNMTASNTLVCSDRRSKCIYEVLKNDYIQGHQIWRTCSNPQFEPCDPNSAPPGLTMVRCSHCETDKCNLYGPDPGKNTVTISINGTLNLSIE